MYQYPGVNGQRAQNGPRSKFPAYWALKLPLLWGKNFYNYNMSVPRPQRPRIPLENQEKTMKKVLLTALVFAVLPALAHAQPQTTASHGHFPINWVRAVEIAHFLQGVKTETEEDFANLDKALTERNLQMLDFDKRENMTQFVLLPTEVQLFADQTRERLDVHFANGDIHEFDLESSSEFLPNGKDPCMIDNVWCLTVYQKIEQMPPTDKPVKINGLNMLLVHRGSFAAKEDPEENRQTAFMITEEGEVPVPNVPRMIEEYDVLPDRIAAFNVYNDGVVEMAFKPFRSKEAFKDYRTIIRPTSNKKARKK